MSDIKTGGPNKIWNVVAFYYTSLPNPNNWEKTWFSTNLLVPGATSFPTSNLYFQSTSAGLTTYNFFHKSYTGLYELGKHVMDSPPYDAVNTPEKPAILFPVDYNIPNNVVNQDVSTLASTSTTQTRLNVTIDAYGTLDLVTGSISSPVNTIYNNCIRTMTYSVDTMTLAGWGIFFLKTKTYNWYSPTLFEPIVSYSVTQIRNDIDPAYWSLDSRLPWRDEIKMDFVVPNLSVGIEQEEQSGCVLLIPNPSTGPVTMVMSETGSKHIEVYNIVGKLLLNTNTSLERYGFNMDQYGPGIYLVKVTSVRGASVTKKLIVK